MSYNNSKGSVSKAFKRSQKDEKMCVISVLCVVYLMYFL